MIFFAFSSVLYGQQTRDTVLDLYYNTASFELDSSQIKSVSNFISSVQGIREIVGYADTVGTVNYNRNLSRLRAMHVYQIVSSQINLDHNYLYRGEEFSQDADLSINRKVEIIGYKSEKNKEQDNTVRYERVDSFEASNINFMPDRSIITPESINSIPQLVGKIKSYQNAHFDIVGHVNYQSDKDKEFLLELFKLSEERAKVIYEVLIENGVSESLLKYKGVGNSQPLIKEPKNVQEKMKNMRVQIIVLKTVQQE